MRSRRMSNRWTSWRFAALLLALGPVGAAWAQVSVTAADPSSAEQGTASLDVTITGNGFDRSAAVRFLVTGTEDTGGITVKKVSVKNARRLVATIDVATTALQADFDIEVTLNSGRKGKGTTLFKIVKRASDPCASAVDFPSFVFHRNTGQSGTFVADRTGICVRFLKADVTRAKFSYPLKNDLGEATTRGRIVWRGNLTEGRNRFFAMDFVIVGTDVLPGPTYLVADVGPDQESGGENVCCEFDLSADGRNLYVPVLPVLRDEGYVSTIDRVRLPTNLEEVTAGLPPRVPVFEHPPGPQSISYTLSDVSVNGPEDFLYLIQWHYLGYGNGSEYRLLRVDLDADMTDSEGNPEVVTLWDRAAGGSLAADASNTASDLVVFLNIPDSGCSYLVVMNGRTGTVLNEGSQWPAFQTAFSSGKVLSRHFRSGCRFTDSLVEMDPLTGATVTLTTGELPDGR